MLYSNENEQAISTNNNEENVEQKKLDTVWFHLHKVQKQAQLLYNVTATSQNSGYSDLWKCSISSLFFFFFFFLAILGFELRAWHLLGRCSTT
jgi:hypothetical protein